MDYNTSLDIEPNASLMVEDSAFVDWLISTQERIVQILKTKGYFSGRYAKVTLAQKQISRGVRERRILLADWEARLAFMVVDGKEIRPKMELEPIIWATAIDCYHFLVKGPRQRADAFIVPLPAYTRNPDEITDSEQKSNKACGAEDDSGARESIQNDWTVV
ncbi:hypothetical protein MMC07_001887 [Pseudocyphellaria aurata]|nr:hypothetical protein [Pseudocyphellaria aurata]